MRGAIALTLLLLASSGAPAQDVVIRGDGRAVTPPTSRAAADQPRESAIDRPPEHRSILLDPLQVALHDSLAAEVAPFEPIPGSVQRVSRGIRAAALRRIFGFYRSTFTEGLRTRWEKGSDSLLDIERQVRLFYEAEADRQLGGRWWDRTWRQSLVPERGGAPAEPTVLQVGREIELVRVGPLAFTSEVKLRLGKLSVYLDDDRLYERVEDRARAALRPARSDANLARSDAENEPRRTLVEELPRTDVSVSFDDDATVEVDRLRATRRSNQRARRADGRARTPRGSLVTGEGWAVSVRSTLQLRPPDEGPASAITYATAQLDLDLYPGHERIHFATVSLKLRTRPRDDFYVAQLEVEVVSF